MQRIAVIGGTGMTGQCVVDYALKKGLQVRLLYRTEKTVPDRFKGTVEMVQGNVTNYDDCRKAVEGVDGVCIILGTRNNLEATTELSAGTENLILAMKSLGVGKFSIVMSSFQFRPVSEVPAMFRYINEEHQRMLDLTKASGLEYIAILPPHISDECSSSHVVEHNVCSSRVISKYDLAKFIVDCLDNPMHYGRVCGISKLVDK